MHEHTRQEMRRILHIAIPSIISNITVPLLGMIDLAITGHLSQAHFIAAVAMGSTMMNVLLWLFGFLRMGTAGLTSQSYGRGEPHTTGLLLLHGLVVALTPGVLLMLLFPLLIEPALSLMHATGEVRVWAKVYVGICIKSVPAALMLYAFFGWFIGMQNTRFTMYISIFQNIVNIAGSLFFVFVCHMQVAGIAYGTLTAQYAGLLLAVFLFVRHYAYTISRAQLSKVFCRQALTRFLRINSDIFLRTLCIIGVTLYFTTAGMAQGETILSVNTLLMQFFTLFAYVMDGFAYAGEALAGRHIGARDAGSYRLMVRLLFRCGIVLSGLFTVVYLLGGRDFLQLLTSHTSVVDAAMPYFPWALFIPFAGFAAFLWDGIFVGATQGRFMLIAAFSSLLIFFLLYFSLRSSWGNHALWCAFLAYLLMRGLLQQWLSARVYAIFFTPST